MEILLVDDNPAGVGRVAEALSRAGITNKIRYANNRLDALAILGQEGRFADLPTPDLILLALNHGEQDWRYIVTGIEGNPRLNHVPVLLLPPSYSAKVPAPNDVVSGNSPQSKIITFHRLDDAVLFIERMVLEPAQNPEPCSTVTGADPETGKIQKPDGIGSEEASSASPSSQGSETILIVEDEVMLKQVMSLLLRRQGYRVLEAANANEALDLWQGHGAEIDLVITDLSIPDGISGRDLAALFRSKRPDIPVIFSSGFDSETDANLEQMVEGENFLPKPFLSGDLSRIIRKCLDHRPG